MDQRKCEESGRNVLDFKCEKILPEDEKSTSLSAAVVQSSDTNIVSQTPEKNNERLNAKERGVKHLDIYNAMVELFFSMTCSLRLLSLSKKLQTFKNISAQVEVLTKRKFSFRHLAQIKYILQEAIQIDSIIVHDKKTLCMEPVLKIALLFDVVEGHNQRSDYLALRQVFDSRLVNFFTIHPEACDIPEATLPEPFSLRSQISLEKMAAEFPEAVAFGGGNSQTFDLVQSPPESMESLPNSADTQSLLTSSLLHPAFSPHFCQKPVAVASQKTKLLTLPASASSAVSNDLNIQSVKTWQAEESAANLLNNKGVKSKQQMEPQETCSKASVVLPHVQAIISQGVGSLACESPLLKLASPADSLLIETPAQGTPKRSMASCDNKHKAASNIQDCTSHVPAKRFIDFSHLEGERSTVDSSGMQTDSDNKVSLALLEMVEESHGNLTDDCKMRQSEIVANKDISVCLTNLVASIHHIRQTINCSSITKQELVHKIIMNNLDITERREVEEQIEYLEKLVPEWICKNLVPGGEVIYNIKKVSNLTSIQARVYKHMTYQTV